ncbi:MAG: hypothetical protein ACXW38_11135 [Nitrospira sp.]
MGVVTVKRLVDVTQETSGAEEALGSGSCCWCTVRFRARAVEGAVKSGRWSGNRVAA